MKYTKILGLVLTSLLMLSYSLNAVAIQKCKDAEGKWHYGDYAEDKCESSKVTNLNERGFVTDTIDAPKTEEEKLVEAKIKLKEEQELAELKKKQAERDRVLSIYEREEDIDRQRDNQLASVEGNIRVHKAYLKQMDSKIKRLESKSEGLSGKRKEYFTTQIEASKGRVTEFSAELKRLEAQKISISEKFASEKKLYRELTASE